jgi:tetratricopeptide (TPR) repeat protein
MTRETDIGRILERGYAAFGEGRIGEAADCCREALARDPQSVPAHFLVGLAAAQSGDRQNAFRAFGSVTRLAPTHAAAWAHLARLLIGEGEIARADAALAKAAEHERGEPLLLDLIGAVHALLGEHERASTWFQRAVAARPQHAPFLQNLANNLIYLGEGEAGRAHYARLLQLAPDHPQAHWALAGARRATDGRHIDELRALAQRPGLEAREAAFLHYAIGKECEDLERWDEAFEAFATGAALRRQTVEYDEPAEIEMFRTLEATFTAEWLARAGAGTDGEGPMPVFVVGQPRTGTTLVERILASHSGVRSAGELQQFGLSIRRLSSHRDPKRFSAALFETAAALDAGALGRQYLTATRRVHGDGAWVVDKLPQNYFCVPLILAALPRARIVHVMREPMDACFASFKQLFADAYLHSYDQREMARHHARYRHLMAVWRERFGARYLEVDYEDTVRDVEATARRMLAALGLPWEDGVARFHESGGAVSTASAVQVREPAHTRSVGRWRRYAVQLEPMRAELAAAGYPVDRDS